MTNEDNQTIKRRVIALLDRQELEFLDRLSADASFSTGHKLSRVDILGALVDAAMAMELNAVNVHNKEELVTRMLNIARNQIDRRKFPRVKKDLKVGLRIMDSLKPFQKSSTEDVSLGGFRMELPRSDGPVSLHQIVEVTLEDVSSGSATPVKAIGKIVWIKRKEGGSGFEVGAKITYIREEDKKRFTEYTSLEPDWKGTQERAS